MREYTEVFYNVVLRRTFGSKPEKLTKMKNGGGIYVVIFITKMTELRGKE